MSLAKSWFDHTFTSRQTTEQLLRPDYESGLLSQHDFDLAVSFLPGHHRYLPYVHTVIWGALAGFTLYRFKPKVRFPTTIVGASAVSGYGLGLFHYFREHRKFARQLEDRQAFLLVLNNVNKRLGNPTPLFPQMDVDKILDSVMKRKEEHGEVLSPGVELVGDASELPTDGTTTTPTRVGAPPNVQSQSPEQSSTRHKSAWDAIREANGQNAGKHSSWDELRQRHERQRVSPERTSLPQEQSAPELEDPRAKAQAEFDAILEAERKAATG